MIIMPLGPAISINVTRWIIRKLYRVAKRVLVLAWRFTAMLARYTALEYRSRRVSQ
jgi:hypothetical protein